MKTVLCTGLLVKWFLLPLSTRCHNLNTASVLTLLQLLMLSVEEAVAIALFISFWIKTLTLLCVIVRV